MEYVRLLLKHKQPGFSATLELAAELAGRELRKPELTREIIRISDADHLPGPGHVIPQRRPTSQKA
jgi:hypothetical protein